jgi:hypothetical protein
MTDRQNERQHNHYRLPIFHRRIRQWYLPWIWGGQPNPSSPIWMQSFSHGPCLLWYVVKTPWSRHLHLKSSCLYSSPFSCSPYLPTSGAATLTLFSCRNQLCGCKCNNNNHYRYMVAITFSFLPIFLSNSNFLSIQYFKTNKPFHWVVCSGQGKAIEFLIQKNLFIRPL